MLLFSCLNRTLPDFIRDRGSVSLRPVTAIFFLSFIYPSVERHSRQQYRATFHFTCGSHTDTERALFFGVSSTPLMLFKPLEHARLMKSRDSSNHFLFFFFSKKKEKNLTISKPCTAGHPLHTICHQMGQPQMHMVTAKTLVCSPSLSSVLTRVCKSSFKIFIYFKKKVEMARDVSGRQ